MDFLVLYSVDMPGYINSLLGIKPTLHSWNKSHLVVLFNHFYMSHWIQSVSIFCGCLYLYSQEILICSFLFLVISLSGGSSFKSPRIGGKE